MGVLNAVPNIQQKREHYSQTVMYRLRNGF